MKMAGFPKGNPPYTPTNSARELDRILNIAPQRNLADFEKTRPAGYGKTLKSTPHDQRLTAGGI
ncbi:hypothetical protein A2671_00410 [Candidatus Kaiserbacteria bacterium RIFCSPHIGHO2_01_FULL_49_13]|uniref:Uncharacterized protein n=1 Tax=Candidatus Kaiserbacteria bacterium RIFCSPHIGHO2_01_FULL_49_13 TaxID=1798477 RepID=A0A1F6CDK0_9BACT|nr:MAG: hypothetical protein A2671_00410 [Candidatus Kaiserbacteria bacterium RIFCSPHIGHO2_01_FULL_49_13]